MKRIICALLILTLVFPFASCSKENNVALTCGETSISKDIFYSQLISYKSDFLYSYLGVTEDDALLWEQDAPSGRLETLGEALIRMVVEDMTQFAWVVEYARANGATITEEDEKDIKTSKESLREYFENEEEYKAYLDSLKMTEEVLDDYMLLTKLYDKGFKMLTAEGAPYALPENAARDYYDSNFVTVKHIFINNVNKLADDSESVVALTEDEIKAKNDYADSIVKQLDDGADFDSLYELSEDKVAESYPDGITFSENMMSDTEYEKFAIEMKEGEYKRLDAKNGGIYIIKKQKLLESDFENFEIYVTSLLNEEISMKIYSEHKSEVTVNEELINSYSMAEVPVD